MKHKPTDIENIRDSARAVREAQLAKPLWQRLREATSRGKLLSTVPSGSVSEYTTRGKTEGSAPPAQDVLDMGPYLRRIENALDELEAEIRAHTGHGEAKNYVTMLGEEKDRELVDNWQGIPSFTVAREAPHFGRTPRTIERARKREAERRGLLIDVKTGTLLGRDLRAA